MGSDQRQQKPANLRQISHLLSDEVLTVEEGSLYPALCRL
jgi:hypothetical protein